MRRAWKYIFRRERLCDAEIKPDLSGLCKYIADTVIIHCAKELIPRQSGQLYVELWPTVKAEVQKGRQGHAIEKSADRQVQKHPR